MNKLKHQPEKLKLYDEAFKTQEKLGIIEKIEYPSFALENPQHSFIAHSAVFKDKASTKCRIVLLSNLAEKSPHHRTTVTHNAAVYPGPCLNRKLFTAFLLLRFDRFLVCYDIVKAFFSVGIPETSQNRLLIHWVKDAEKMDFSPVTFRMKRLVMGNPCSPTLLMTALYKTLMLDTETDSPELINLKRRL